MNRHTGFSFAVVVLLVACGGSDASVKSGPGTAFAKLADWEWNIVGTCEVEGYDMSFHGPGDPWLEIGFSTAGEPRAVGNLRAHSMGVFLLIGPSDQEKPDVKIDGHSYAVSGVFGVPNEPAVDYEIRVVCE